MSHIHEKIYVESGSLWKNKNEASFVTILCSVNEVKFRQKNLAGYISFVTLNFLNPYES
jgi:hypothetical protein